MAPQITCVVAEHSDPDGRIDRVGGRGWVKDESTVIRDIEAGHHYFVEIFSAWITVVVVRRGAAKYLSTDPDLTPENNLLSLPPCG